MNEATLWSQQIRRVLLMSPPFYVAMAERIENGLAPGVPDAFYCINGLAGWVENKYRLEAPKRESTIVFPGGKGLRKEQVAWWMNYLRARGRGFLVAGVAREAFVIRATRQTILGFNSMTWGQIRRYALLSQATQHSFL